MIKKLTNLRIVHDGKIKKQNVYIINNKISLIPSVELDNAVQIIDCKNQILCPGFIDLQINGGFNIDFTFSKDLSSELLEFSKKITSTGCTSFCPTMISSKPEVYHNNISNIKPELNSKGKANNLGFHLEGPFIDVKKKGCHEEKNIIPMDDIKSIEDAKEIIKKVYGDNLDKITIVTLDCSQENSQYLIQYLASEGIVVSIGHTSSNFESACKAMKNGASSVTHIFNAMNPFGSNDSGIYGIFANTDYVYKRHLKLSNQKEIYSNIIYSGHICDLAHVSESAIKCIHKLNPEGLILITDAMAGLENSEGTYTIGDTEVEIRNNPRKALKKGTETLAGSICPINKCIKNFIDVTGCSIPYGINAATFIPAKAIGLDECKGKIEEGFDADLVLIDDEFNVLFTMVSGEIVYNDSNFTI